MVSTANCPDICQRDQGLERRALSTTSYKRYTYLTTNKHRTNQVIFFPFWECYVTLNMINKGINRCPPSRKGGYRTSQN